MVARLALKHGTVLQEDENKIFQQLIMFVYKKEKEQLKSLHGNPKTIGKYAVNNVSCVLTKLDFKNLTKLDNSMYAAAAYVSELALNFQRQRRNFGVRDD